MANIKSFSSTYVYDVLGFSRDVNHLSTETNPNLDKYRLTDSDLLPIISDFKHKVNLANKIQVLESIEKGEIIFVRDPNCRLPIWFLGNNSNSYKVVVNLFGKYSPSTDKKPMTYMARELYGMAVLGYVALKVRMNEKEIGYAMPIIKPAVAIYSRMVMRIIDILYAINTDQVKGSCISFLIGKFFMINLTGREKLTENDLTLIYNSTKRTNSISFASVLENTKEFDQDGVYDNFSTFIEAIAKFGGQNLASLNVNDVLRKVILTYGEKSAYMLESLYFFIAMSVSSVLATGVIKDFIFENINGQDGVKLAAAVFEKFR